MITQEQIRILQAMDLNVPTSAQDVNASGIDMLKMVREGMLKCTVTFDIDLIFEPDLNTRKIFIREHRVLDSTDDVSFEAELNNKLITIVRNPKNKFDIFVNYLSDDQKSNGGYSDTLLYLFYEWKQQKR